MERRFYTIALPLAVAVALFSCQTGTAQYAVGTNSTMAWSGVDGYPAPCSTCGEAAGSCGCGHFGNGQLKARIDHASEVNKRAYDRNRAWPKPFACADRQLYFTVWNSMFESGMRCNCVFTGQHFDPQTHELNAAGKSKISGIFQNSPNAQKIALVQNSGPSDVVDARLRNLQAAIDQWYGSSAFSEVALTDSYPNHFAGRRVESINQQLFDNVPPPIIPVASGTGSTTSTTGQ